MQTGYDSWMYQNQNRPEPLHNLQNNNHYSDAVFTDSNRHVQNGRLLNHFNNRMQPPNNVAYYHQNSQYRTSDFHQMPSSIYLEPFRPSNISNTQPRRASVNWSGRSGYLPQNSYTHENFSSACSENHNRSSQVSSSADENNVKINPAPANSNIHQISRIRVKDVHSINNNNISDSFLQKAMLQTNSKQQRESVINCGSNNYSAVDLGPQTKFIDNTYLAQSKLPPSYYRFAASEQPQQSCSRFGRRPSTVVSENNTSTFVPQEIHPDSYSPDKMLQRACTNEKALENTNSGQSGSVQTYDQITCGIFNPSNNSQVQNCGQNDLESTAYSETLSSSKMSSYGTFGISNSSHVLTIPDCHENVSKSSDANLGGFNSPKTPRSNLNTQLSSNSETSTHYPKQEGTLIKISIPHTGQSSFIRLNDTNSANNSLNFSLPCLLDSKNECFNTAKEDRLSNNKININERLNSSVLQTSKNIPTAPTSVEFLQDFSSSVLSNASSLRKVTSPKQFFINVNKESVSNSVPQSDLNSKTGIKKVSRLSIPGEDIKFNLLTVKQEKFLTAESLRESDHSFSEDDDFDRIITREKIPVEETFPKTPKHIPLEKSKKSKSLGNSVPKGRMLKKRIRQHISYRSKINRVKLDMLIQFLRKDDEPGQASLETPCEKTTNENVKCSEKHRIRKLSKASIVRNKNVSREMVSLVSQKTPRVDPSKSLSETSHTVNSNVDLQKEEKENSAEPSERSKNENSTFFSEHQSQKEDSSQSERNNNELVTGEVQKPAFECLTGERDKELINMMRILRTMTNNFCTNCKLSSSADSFWVNVVSFELRCLNCFKKFLSKELTTKSCGYDTGKQEVNSGNESNLNDVGNSTSKEIHHEKSCHLKEENLTAKLPEESSKGRRESFEKSKRKKSLKDEEGMIDGRENSEENVSLVKTAKKSSSLPNFFGEKFERKSSFCDEGADETSREKGILKHQHVDNRSQTSESECENGKLLRCPTKKVEKKEDVPKREKIENVDTPKRSPPNKTSMADECAKKEVKNLMDSKEKEKSIEEPKISKYSKPEMSEISRIPFRSKEISYSNESKSKSDPSDLEKKKSLKRKHSNEDPSTRKVYIPDDNSSERMEVVTHPSEKTKSSTSPLKDGKHKNKPESENQDSKSSKDKSKEKDVFPQKIKSTAEKYRTDDSIKSPRKKNTEGRRESK